MRIAGARSSLYRLLSSLLLLSFVASSLALFPPRAHADSDAPTNLVSTSITGAVKLDWTAPVTEGLENYSIYRSTSPIADSPGAPVAFGAVTYSGFFPGNCPCTLAAPTITVSVC
jgi:hypothetical protein